MDLGSGDSWYVLGNAYVASFFKNSRGIKDLDRALQAYKKAVRSGLLRREIIDVDGGGRRGIGDALSALNQWYFSSVRCDVRLRKMLPR